jgi:hypothetical protein
MNDRVEPSCPAVNDPNNPTIAVSIFFSRPMNKANKKQALHCYTHTSTKSGIVFGNID